MKNIMAITFGLLLLVSAVAAEGNSNVANVATTDSMAGQIMTNANFAQASNIDANLDGNSINTNQISNMDAVDNILTGSKPDGKTFFFQSVDQSISDTGNSNVDTQTVGGLISPIVTGISTIDSGLIAAGNTLTNSAASQIIGQSEIVEGNSNVDTQTVGGPIIPIVTGIGTIDSGLVAAGNTLTDSVSSQIIGQSEIVEGNSNVDTQTVGGLIGPIVTGISTIDSGLIATGNTLTGSVSSQIIGQSEIVEGNSNVDTQTVGGPIIPVVIGISTIDSGLVAAGNTLTDSVSSQIIGQNDTDIGNSNAVTQLANTIMTSDILTESGALQKTDENVHSLGNANAFSQNEALASTANTVTGGIITQQADVFSSS